MTEIPSPHLDLLFEKGRTHSTWQKKSVSDDTLKKLYNIIRFGPTSANSCPARFVFIKSNRSKERLRPHLSAGNIDKTMAAPITAIIAHDLKFTEHLPKLFPHEPNARTWFEGNEAKMVETAFRNGTLQGAYLIIGARALGLDCGPMSGFDSEGVDNEFFPDGRIKTNFLCNFGYGDNSHLLPRSPRLDFPEVAEII